MNATVMAMIFGAGIGFGFFLFLRSLRRRPMDLATAVRPSKRTSSSDRGGPYSDGPSATVAGDLSVGQRYFSRPGLRLLESLGLTDRGLLRRQLRILDKSLERYAYEKMLAAVVGLLLPVFFVVALRASAIVVSPMLTLVGSLTLGGLGFFYPDLPLSDQVNKRQQAFRHALSSYLDLVSIILAGGGGIESALIGAAEAGEGWVFAEIRSALRKGELTGRSPWDVFDELGADYGIEELRELASSISLAGGHGARVRQSLIAKSEALRAQQTAEIETMAESNTEKMIVPVSIMVLGLMVFIGRGAMAAIGGTPTVEPPAQVVEVQP